MSTTITVSSVASSIKVVRGSENAVYNLDTRLVSSPDVVKSRRLTIPATEIGLDYSVKTIRGSAYLAYDKDRRFIPIRVTKKNRKRIDRLGEGYFTYDEVRAAAKNQVQTICVGAAR